MAEFILKVYVVKTFFWTVIGNKLTKERKSKSV